MNINEHNIQALRSEINGALEAIAKKYGMKIEAGRAKYSSESVKFELACSNVSMGGVVQTIEYQTLIRYLSLLNLTMQDLDTVFFLGGQEFKIVGYVPRKHARPFQIKDQADGKIYYTNEQAIRHGLKK